MTIQYNIRRTTQTHSFHINKLTTSIPLANRSEVLAPTDMPGIISQKKRRYPLHTHHNYYSIV